MMGLEYPRRDVAGWRAEAACAGRTDLFYPAPGDVRSERAAKEICSDCPSRRPCLDDAMAMARRLDFGVRGGLTEAERGTARRSTGLSRRNPLVAEAAARRPAASIGRPRQPIRHGTESGAQQHRRRYEIPCEACATAEAAVRARRKQAQRDRRAAGREAIAETVAAMPARRPA